MTDRPYTETWRVIDLYPFGDGKALCLRGERSGGPEGDPQRHAYLYDADGRTKLYLDSLPADRSALLGKVTGTVATLTRVPGYGLVTEARFRSK